jgi:hypothetical protein
MKKCLYDFFSIKHNKPYSPSKDLANFLISITSSEVLLPTENNNFLLDAITDKSCYIHSACLEIATEHIAAKRNKNALWYLQQSLTLESIANLRTPNLSYLIAVNLIELGLLSESIPLLEREISIQPEHSDALEILKKIKEGT